MLLDNTRVRVGYGNYFLFVTDNFGRADVHFDARSYVTVIMFLISEKTAPGGREKFCIRNYTL